MKTMPLPEIISNLQALTGCPGELAERFLSELEAVVTDRLIAEGTAVIQGLGTFRRVETSDGVSVVFVPDTVLADAVNAPFAIFEPIELDDEVTGDMLEEAASEVITPDDTTLSSEIPTSDEPDPTPTEAESEPARSPEPEPTLPAKPAQSDEQPTESESIPERDGLTSPAEDRQETVPGDTEEPEAESIPDEPVATETEPEVRETDTSAIAENPESPESDRAAAGSQESPVPHEPVPVKTVAYEKVIEKEKVVNVVDRQSHTFHIVLASLLSLAAGLAIGYFAYGKLNISGVRSVNISAEDVQIYHRAQGEKPDADTSEEAPADTVGTPAALPDSLSGAPHSQSTQVVQAVQTPDTHKPVTDTVKSNRFLTTMAQEHYGKKKFWVYIYKENEARLGDPDKIAPNTEVIIPPAGKYGIRPGDKSSEADAERLAQEILGKYNRD